jgi:hypothetical protein
MECLRLLDRLPSQAMTSMSGTAGKGQWQQQDA